MANQPAVTLLRYLRGIMPGPRDDQVSDRDLVVRFVRHRDEAAFAALLRRHGPMVLRLCRRLLHDEHEAEDVFQATFLALARQAPSIRKPEAVAGWLQVRHLAKAVAVCLPSFFAFVGWGLGGMFFGTGLFLVALTQGEFWAWEITLTGFVGGLIGLGAGLFLGKKLSKRLDRFATPITGPSCPTASPSR